jgi:hypothetical protein
MRTFESKRTLLTAVVSLGLGACGLQAAPEDEYRSALPSLSALSIEVPDSPSEPGKLTSALNGEQAQLYTFARDTATDVNGFVHDTLSRIREIVEHPVTAVRMNVAVWGPHTADDGVLTWKLTVMRQGPGQYLYALAARRADDERESAFRTIIFGRSTKGFSPVFSGYHGGFTADGTLLHELAPDTYPEEAKGVVSYDTRGLKRRVNLALEAFTDEGDRDAAVLYHYMDRADGSGEFRFAAHADIDDEGAKRERSVVRAHWIASGQGRGRAVITGGDVPVGVSVIAHECWDETHARTFYKDNLELNPTEGDPASCAFGERGPHPEEADDEIEVESVTPAPDSSLDGLMPAPATGDSVSGSTEAMDNPSEAAGE